MISAFPKIHTVGKRDIINVLDHEVEITEKIDGSQFAFGRTFSGDLICRSKGQLLDIYNPGKLFKPAVDYVHSIQDRLLHGYIYYGETLYQPRHNKLKYERIPKNHIALYYAYDQKTELLLDLKTQALILDVDMAPILYEGKINASDILQFLDRESYLGGKIEGIVIKNYHNRQYAKLVCDEFKEVKLKLPKSKDSAFEEYKEAFRTTARWEKAVIHLKEQSKLTGTSSDIGLLCKEVQQDVEAEEKDAIQEWLWKKYGKEVIKHSVLGLATWYQNLA